MGIVTEETGTGLAPETETLAMEEQGLAPPTQLLARQEFIQTFQFKVQRSDV